MNTRFLLLLLLCPVIVTAQTGTPAKDTTETDWQAVLALEAGPQKLDVRSQDQARAITLAHLAKQETSLREFLRKHPGPPHDIDAQLRLAHVLATRSNLTENAAEFDAALRLLSDARKAAPAERYADLDFARIALAMRNASASTDQGREALTAQMQTFQANYPSDRRLGSLMAEIATLYDDQPKRKKELLTQALAAAGTPELRARIQDDLNRLALLGSAIELRGTTVTGAEIDLAQFRGKVTLIYFFAGWSLPSLAGLEEVEHLRKTFAKDSVEIIGVSLDPTREALDATLKPRNITWPILFDGKGWKSPLVRSLYINAIPTLWVVDRQGKLRTLNAKRDSEALVRELLKEK